jgi:hypothetical protein
MATNTLSDQELLDAYEKATGKKFDLSAPIPEPQESPVAAPSAEPSPQVSPSPLPSPSPDVLPGPLPSPSPSQISDLELIKRAEKAGLGDYYKQLEIQEGPPKDYLLALETGIMPDFGPEKEPFGPMEIAGRSVRSAAAGIGTEAVSEPYFGAFGAAQQMSPDELLDVIFTHPGIGTQKKIQLYQKFQDAYSKDLARQQQFKETYPAASMISEGLGMAAGVSKMTKPIGAALEVGEQAIKPGYEMLSKQFPSLVTGAGTTEARVITPLARLGLGKEAAEKFMLPGDKPVSVAQNVGQLAKGAMASAAAMQAGSEFAKATAGSAEPTSEQIKNIVATTVSAPVFALGLGAGVVGGTMAASAAKQSLKKAALSKPAKIMYNLLFGPSVRAQEKFLQVEKELETIASTEDVKLFYDNLREYILGKKDWSTAELNKAKEVMKGIYGRLPSVKSEAVGAQKELANQKREALSNLRVMIEDIIDQSKVAVAGETGKIQRMGKTVDLTPHAENLKQNLELYQQQLIQQSKDSVELIHPDTIVTADQLIDLYRQQIKKLSIEGLEEGTALGDTNQQAIKMLQQKIDYIRKAFTTDDGGQRVLQGEAVKQAVKDLQKDYEKHPFADFNSSYQAAINSIQQGLNSLLKESNPLYAEAMVPIAKGFNALNNFRPIVGARNDNTAYEAAKLRIRKAADDKVYEQQMKELADAVGDSSLLDGIDELRLAKMQGSPEAKMAALQSNTVLEKARMAESLLKATKNKQMAMDLRIKYPDDPNVKEIADLWDTYTDILDPQNLAKAKNDAINKFAAEEIAPQAFQEEAALKLQRKYQDIGKAFDMVESGNWIEKFLRNFKKDQMTEQAAKIVDRISNLDPEEFSQFFKTINVKDPKDFARIVELLRIQKEIDTPNIQGSRRVVFLKAIMTVAMGGVAGATSSAIAGNWAINAALGAGMGMAFDNYGPKIAQSWLRAINRIDGVPSYKKMLNAFPFVPDDRLRSVLAAEMASYVQNVNPEEFSYISMDNIPSFIRDVAASEMPSVKKARIINELSKTNTIRGDHLIELTLDGIGQTRKPKPVAARLIEPEKPKTIKQDRPDVLKAMSKGGAK